MKRPKSIKIEDTERILLHLREQDSLIFRVCAETGLRISDVLDLRAWYLNKVLYVRERKTGKHRIVELSDELYGLLEPIKQSALRAYGGAGDKEQYAFPSARAHGKPVHRSGYHRRLKKVCALVGVDFSAHSTRKLYAQELMKKTGDIFAVQKALNHKFVSDTCTYLDIDLGALIGAATVQKELQKK